MKAIIDFGQPLTGAERLVAEFADPVEVFCANRRNEVPGVLAAVEAAARSGWWCVGGLTYEAASALDPLLITHQSTAPLAWFARYPPPAPTTAEQLPQAPAGGAVGLSWTETARVGFDQAIATIRKQIADGSYYQLNYTHQWAGVADAAVDPAALFTALSVAQPGGYALLLDRGAEQVCSVSPELFFDWHQPATGAGRILTRPMKGTATRGGTAQADRQQANKLRASAKERAENLMIVDLLRNDLATFARLATVRVPRLFALDQLPTVWQLTSDVTAEVPADVDLLTIVRALFPCGSVTGAPKIAAMSAICALEPEPRGWYCGMLGVVRPDGAGGLRSTFNVAIRTLVVQQHRLRCGIGSGITFDSTADGEWAEWQAKRAFVERVSSPFELLETLALEAGKLRHRERHLRRLSEAADHFGFPSATAADELDQVAAMHPVGSWRVRLLLSPDGRSRTETHPHREVPEPVHLQWAQRPLTTSHGEFVRFKTTRRAHYAAFSPANPAVFDTLLWNDSGEITECTRGNIAALLDGRWVTPALNCGLLAGVQRAVALDEGTLSEQVITLEDAARVKQWAYLNSLRGWLTAIVIGAPPRLGR